jgi:hypothetical protein
MIAKALYVSLQQTLRSAALTFFPAAFTALIIWATAGSSTGNTSDPLRGSLWLWLAMHLVHFKFILSSTTSGALSYLPIGALALPLLSLRSGVKRLRYFGEANAVNIMIFFAGYELLLLLSALISQSSAIKPSLSYIPLISIPTFFIAWVSSLEKLPPIFSMVRDSVAVLLLCAGISSIIFGAALFLHMSVVKSLAAVIQPGWVGGLFLLVLQIMYLPNIIFAMLSYSLGFGYAIGAHTHVAPKWFVLDQIPALQSFGALPRGEHPAVLYLIIFYVLLLTVVILRTSRRVDSLGMRVKVIALSTLVLSLLLLALSYLSGGELLTFDLAPVGVRWWPLAASFAACNLALVLLVVLIPAGISHLVSNHRSKKMNVALSE